MPPLSDASSPVEQRLADYFDPLYLARERCRTEQVYRECKQELGLDRYEGRRSQLATHAATPDWPRRPPLAAPPSALPALPAHVSVKRFLSHPLPETGLIRWMRQSC